LDDVLEAAVRLPVQPIAEADKPVDLTVVVEVSPGVGSTPGAAKRSG
jgi:hypothetical protein